MHIEFYYIYMILLHEGKTCAPLCQKTSHVAWFKKTHHYHRCVSTWWGYVFRIINSAVHVALSTIWKSYHKSCTRLNLLVNDDTHSAVELRRWINYNFTQKWLHTSATRAPFFGAHRRTRRVLKICTRITHENKKKYYQVLQNEFQETEKNQACASITKWLKPD